MYFNNIFSIILLHHLIHLPKCVTGIGSPIEKIIVSSKEE